VLPLHWLAPHDVPLDGHAAPPLSFDTQTPPPAAFDPQHFSIINPQFELPHGSPGGAHSETR
jgi:hypothetical protein